MRKQFFFGIATLIMAMLTLMSCSETNKSGRTDTLSTGTIQFAADGSISPIIEEQRVLFEVSRPQAHLVPIYTNETEGINLLMTDSICLVISARDFKAEELKNLKDRKFMPRSLKLAYDGLALIVNRQNADTCISVSDIKRILLGEATKWSDIYKGSTRGDITVVFDNPGSGTVHFAEDSILGGKAIKNPNVVATENSADVIAYVEKNVGAIGIIGSNWLNDKRDSTNLTFHKDITVMNISRLTPATPANSYKPYEGYFYNGNYPLVRTIWALLNDPYNGLPKGFFNFLQSPQGQLVFHKAGLLPCYGNMTVRDVHVSDQ